MKNDSNSFSFGKTLILKDKQLFFGSQVDHPQTANLAVIGVPWDISSSYRKGSALAPNYIRMATTNQLYNSFSEMGFDINANWKIFDNGNITVDSNSESKVINAIYYELAKLSGFSINNYCFLGGDHLITYFSFSALLKAYEINPKRVGLLYFDSHPDLYENYDDNRYSHACVVKRLIDETQLLPQNICQLGIRAATLDQLDYIQKSEILMYTTRDIQDTNIHEITNSLKKRFASNVDQIYLSIDLDILDPAFVPGIGNPEPGGLTTSQLIRLIQNLSPLPISSFDLVEVNPKFDLNNLTAFTTAKIVKEILAILQ